MGFDIVGIDHVVLNCSDVDTTAAWYATALGARGARGSMSSIYARDPDGNLVEVSHYG